MQILQLPARASGQAELFKLINYLALGELELREGL
jgi:hypothetical protein